MNETVLTIVGNVVESPEWRVFDSGTSKATFRVAATERRYDRGSGEWGDGDSLFLRVTCWRQLADNVHESLRRGDPVLVTGRLVTRRYEQDGQRKSATYVEATAVGHDLSRGVAEFRRTGRRSAGTAPVPAAEPAMASAAAMASSAPLSPMSGGPAMAPMSPGPAVAPMSAGVAGPALPGDSPALGAA